MPYSYAQTRIHRLISAALLHTPILTALLWLARMRRQRFLLGGSGFCWATAGGFRRWQKCSPHVRCNLLQAVARSSGVLSRSCHWRLTSIARCHSTGKSRLFAKMERACWVGRRHGYRCHAHRPEVHSQTSSSATGLKSRRCSSSDDQTNKERLSLLPCSTCLSRRLCGRISHHEGIVGAYCQRHGDSAASQ